MTVKGHLALASIPISALPGYFILEHWLGVCFLLLGSILPDIDEKGSYIGRKLYFLSGIFGDLGISHRGFTHFAIIPLTIILIGYIVNIDLLIWLGIGIFIHDVGDLLTKGGIKNFLYPFFEGTTFGLLPKKYRFYTFSFVEKLVILLFLVIDVILIMRGWLYYG